MLWELGLAVDSVVYCTIVCYSSIKSYQFAFNSLLHTAPTGSCKELSELWKTKLISQSEVKNTKLMNIFNSFLIML